MSTWIVVADAARARVYEADELRGPWRLRRDLEHPASRKKNVELTPTEPGSAMKSKGNSRHSSFEARSEPHLVEAERFAREITELLIQADASRNLDQLILVAPPRFLGELRGLLSANVAARVLASIDHDYLHLADDELKERVLQHV